jgi:hypothetical protein
MMMFWMDVDVLIKDCRLSSDFAQAAISTSNESKFAQLNAGGGGGGVCANRPELPAMHANNNMEMPSLVRISTLRLAVHQFSRQVRLILPIFSLGRNHSMMLRLNHVQTLAQDLGVGSMRVAMPGYDLPPMPPAGLAMEQAQHVAGDF